jgi:hypothetical protein
MQKHITEHDLDYLFEFNGKHCLIIHLYRFSKEYYDLVFNTDPGNKMAEAFIRKTCIKMCDSLLRFGKPEIDITITIQDKVPSNAHWQKYYINPQFTGEAMSPLIKKPIEH